MGWIEWLLQSVFGPGGAVEPAGEAQPPDHPIKLTWL